MYKKTKRLSPQDMADLAAYYATQKPEQPEGKTAPPLLVTQGDRKRLLLPCEVCHGKNGEGMGHEVPALSGQKIEHFVETITAFKEGERENDQYGRMRFIAHQLSDKEIEEIASYYAAPPEEDEDEDEDE
jgi:cytochrome c553